MPPFFGTYSQLNPHKLCLSIITCASRKKKYLEQNCIGIASIICILAWIIFVSFFSKPDRVTFLKRQLYWAEKSWKSRFLGQQPFLCIKVTIISEFLGCGAFTLRQEPHYIYQVWFARVSSYLIQKMSGLILIICSYRLSHCTEVRFAGGFTTMAVINPPERKLAKRTSVHCTKYIK